MVLQAKKSSNSFCKIMPKPVDELWENKVASKLHFSLPYGGLDKVELATTVEGEG